MFSCEQTSNWHKFAFLVKWTELGSKNELEILLLFFFCLFITEQIFIYM